MRLKEALSVMSMASPYAVSTERNNDITNLHHQVKQYLFIAMPIEKAINQCISYFGDNGKRYGMESSYLMLKDKLVEIKFTRIN